jgi:hypothetical protein
MIDADPIIMKVISQPLIIYRNNKNTSSVLAIFGVGFEIFDDCF